MLISRAGDRLGVDTASIWVSGRLTTLVLIPARPRLVEPPVSTGDRCSVCLCGGAGHADLLDSGSLGESDSTTPSTARVTCAPGGVLGDVVVVGNPHQDLVIGDGVGHDDGPRSASGQVAETALMVLLEPAATLARGEPDAGSSGRRPSACCGCGDMINFLLGVHVLPHPSERAVARARGER